MTLTTHDGVIVLKLNTGIEIEVHPNDSLTINTPARTWDAGLNNGHLMLDGFDVEDCANRSAAVPVRITP